MSKRLIICLVLSLLGLNNAVSAGSVYSDEPEFSQRETFHEQAGLPFDMHRNNLPVKPDDFLLSRSCEELDEAINYMLPATYSYRPGIYNNPYAGAAIWGTASGEFGIMEHLWYYLPYSWLIGYLEDGKRHEAFYKVEQLRRAKAIKSCFVK